MVVSQLCPQSAGQQRARVAGVLGQYQRDCRRAVAGVFFARLAYHLGNAAVERIQFRRRLCDAPRVHRPVAGVVALHRGVHRRNRARRHPRGRLRADRGLGRARLEPRAHPQSGGDSAGIARHRAAAHQPIPQPDQKLIARHRHRLYGYRRHHRRHLAQPNRARNGVHDYRPGVVSVDFAGDFGVYELV